LVQKIEQLSMHKLDERIEAMDKEEDETTTNGIF
jgi:hypothetical protein